MLVLISPSKTLDFQTPHLSLSTQPDFKEEIKKLVEIMKKKKVKDLMKLMDISENLAVLNQERYQNWKDEFHFPDAKQALLAFKGDVYTKMDVDHYDTEDFEFAQKHLRILSGLYGLLKPLDLIQPYRLEMGITLKNPKGKNLYEFWGTRIAKAINEINESQPLINLASQEYFKAVDVKILKSPVISPVFQEFKNGKYQIIGFFAKQARGLMANYIIKNKISQPEQIKLFHEEGYELFGNGEEWRFVR
jgi:uncharacterized protein